jgi:hypothetical protein
VYTAIVELILVESLCNQKEYYLCKSETKEKSVACPKMIQVEGYSASLEK